MLDDRRKEIQVVQISHTFVHQIGQCVLIFEANSPPAAR